MLRLNLRTADDANYFCWRIAAVVAVARFLSAHRVEHHQYSTTSGIIIRVLLIATAKTSQNRIPTASRSAESPRANKRPRKHPTHIYNTKLVCPPKRGLIRSTNLDLLMERNVGSLLYTRPHSFPVNSPVRHTNPNFLTLNLTHAGLQKNK